MAGDIISIVGLFRLKAGNARNVQVVHTGNIAAMPDPIERIPVKNQAGEIIQVEAYLVQTETLDGLSGAPVFIHEPVGITGAKTPEGLTVKGYCGVKLIGVYISSWDAKPGEILAEERSLFGPVRVPVGMGVVVPIDKVHELIMNNTDLKDIRAKATRERNAENAASMDSAIPDPQAKDANPHHKEGFTSLLNAAAKTRTQAD